MLLQVKVSYEPTEQLASFLKDLIVSLFLVSVHPIKRDFVQMHFRSVFYSSVLILHVNLAIMLDLMLKSLHISATNVY